MKEQPASYEFAANVCGKVLSADMSTPAGRWRWARTHSDTLAEQVKHYLPIQPQELQGCEWWHLQEIFRTSRQQRSQDQWDTVKAWRGWRDGILATEGSNASTLNASLLAYRILTETLADAKEQNRYTVQKRLDALRLHIEAQWRIDDVDAVLLQPSLRRYAINYCTDYAAFSVDWRDPLKERRAEHG